MWAAMKNLFLLGTISLLFFGLSGCSGGGISLIISDIQGPSAMNELEDGEFSVEVSGGTNITYQWHCNPVDAGEFYPPDLYKTRFTANEAPADTPVEMWVIINADNEGPVVKKFKLVVRAVPGVNAGYIKGPYEVQEKSEHIYSIDTSGDAVLSYQWSTNSPDICSFETPDAGQTLVNFHDIPFDALIEINVMVTSIITQPIIRAIAVRIVADVNLSVGGIEGPNFFARDDQAEFSVKVISDRTPSYSWSCDPPNAGIFDAPNSMTTGFSPNWIYQDTKVAIRVAVEAEGYEPVLRDYGVILEYQQYGWEKHWGYSYCRDVITDSMGFIYVTGKFHDADLDPGEGVWYSDEKGLYLSKFNGDGEFIWATSFQVDKNSNYYVNGIDLGIDEYDNIYIVGGFKGIADFMPGQKSDIRSSYYNGGYYRDGMFISKHDPNGNVLWVNTWGGISTYNVHTNTGYGIEVGSDGIIYVTGNFMNNMDFDLGPGYIILNSISGTYDVFVSGFDTDGNFLWAQSFGGEYHDYVDAVTTDTQNNVYIAGALYGTVDFDPGPGFVLVTSKGWHDAFISKFNSNGDFQWARTWGGYSTDTVNDISFDNSGYVYATGAFMDSVDFDPGVGTDTHNQEDGAIYVTRFNTDGDFAGAVNFGGTENSEGKNIAFDNSGNICVSGITLSGDFDPGPGYYELRDGPFLLKMDNNFEFQWVRPTVQGKYARGGGVAISQSGDIYVCANSNSETDLNPTPAEELIDFDGYHSLLLKFAGDGYW